MKNFLGFWSLVITCMLGAAVGILAGLALSDTTPAHAARPKEPPRKKPEWSWGDGDKRIKYVCGKTVGERSFFIHVVRVDGVEYAMFNTHDGFVVVKHDKPAEAEK